MRDRTTSKRLSAQMKRVGKMHDKLMLIYGSAKIANDLAEKTPGLDDKIGTLLHPPLKPKAPRWVMYVVFGRTMSIVSMPLRSKQSPRDT